MRHVRQVGLHRLLHHLGEGDLRTSKVQYAEEFVCKLYRVENLAKIDEASVAKLSTLPPVPKACKYIAQYSCSKGCTTLAKGEHDLHGNPTSTGACKCSDGERVSTNKAA